MIRPPVCVWLALPCLYLLLPPRATGAPDQAIGDPRPARVDALFSAWDKPDSPGCVTGVMEQGKLLFAKGYGLADTARGVPLSPDTVFDIASMSKQFTAANIGLLVLERKLALTDDVRASFPELPIDAPVTIDELIHHASGLRDYAELNMLRGVEPIDNKGVIALLARQKALNFPPGSQTAYSNTNYVLLAELVQRTTGKTLATFARERVFGPLKMQSTRYAGSVSADPANLANSYVPAAGGKLIPVPRAIQTVGDGNLLTTVRDLARWDENFYTHRVGGKALIRMMRAPATLTSGEHIPYGFGLMFDEYRGVPTEAHGGSYHGFRTELLRFPQQHFSISVLCNVATADAAGLAHQVADIYLGAALRPQPPPIAPPAEVKIDQQTLDAYAGEYVIQVNGQPHVLLFGRRGDRFFSQFFGEPAFELLPFSATAFFPKTQDARFVFERAKDGAVSSVTLHRASGDLVARRNVAAASPEKLGELAGIYYSEELDAHLRLEILDGHVIVNIGPERRFPLLQISASRFVMPAGGTFEFRRGEAGRVSGFDYSSDRVRGLAFVGPAAVAGALARHH